MTDKEFILLAKFTDKKILQSVDGGLRRAVKALMVENAKLKDRLLALDKKELEKAYWQIGTSE